MFTQVPLLPESFWICHSAQTQLMRKVNVSEILSPANLFIYLFLTKARTVRVKKEDLINISVEQESMACPWFLVDGREATWDESLWLPHFTKKNHLPLATSQWTGEPSPLLGLHSRETCLVLNNHKLRWISLHMRDKCWKQCFYF